MNTFFNFFKQNLVTALLLAYVLYVIFFWDLLMIFPISFIIIFILFKNKISSITICYLDIGFAILFISEIISSLTSTYAFNSIGSYIRLNYMLILYIGYKVFFKDSKRQLLLQKILFIFSMILFAFTLNDFINFQSKLNLVGFTDSINFKHLYTPLGNLINAWGSVLLLFIPLNSLFLWQQRNTKWSFLICLNLFLNCFCLLSSFSRGAYISLVLFIFIINILLRNEFSLKKLIRYNAIAFFIIVIASLPIKKEVLSTISFNATESQQRSTSSRISSWIYVEKLLTDKPIFGWGQNNFILALDKKINKKEDSQFSPRTQNTYINLLVERGIFGFASYLVFFVIILIVLVRNFKSKIVSREDKIKLSLITSGIFAILLREFTYASIFDFNSVYFMFFCLLIFLIPYDIPLIKIYSIKLKYCIPSLFLAAISILLYINMNKVLVVEKNQQFLEAYYKENFKNSKYSITKAIELAPDNINLLKNHSLFLSKNALEIEILEKHPHLLSITSSNKDTLQLAEKDLKKILKLTPYDDENLHNLAWISFALKNNKAAQNLLTEAIKLNPYNSTYHISKVLFNLERENIIEVKKHLIKALRYSPEILESIFYKEFSKKYLGLAKESKQIAISELYAEIKTNNNTVLKARLARLLLEENPNKAKQFLEEVTTALPNLGRPWMYLAYLNSKNTTDSLKVIKNYEKSLFLDPYDFLLNNYYGNYYMQQQKEKKALQFFRMSLLSYGAIKSSSFARNFYFSKIPVLQNSMIPNNLLYYAAADPQAISIFKVFEKYNQMNNGTDKDFYSKKVKLYSQQLFKSELELP